MQKRILKPTKKIRPLFLGLQVSYDVIYGYCQAPQVFIQQPLPTYPSNTTVNYFDT